MKTVYLKFLFLGFLPYNIYTHSHNFCVKQIQTMPRNNFPEEVAAEIAENGLKAKFTIKGKSLTERQKEFAEIAAGEGTKIVFVSGPSGSTKTYMAVYSALQALKVDQSLDLLYVRTAIESADKGLGALPGTLEDKINPYMAPLEDKLDELLPRNNMLKRHLMEKGRIQAMPINFLRGASWENKVVVADESQNFTFKELVTLITRIGENTKLFICGDVMQSDIGHKSGFSEMYGLFNDLESSNKGIHCFGFRECDILRSQILKYIIKKIKGV
jgi:phosphate starvation-inducible protein PhoH and related proteins